MDCSVSFPAECRAQVAQKHYIKLSVVDLHFVRHENFAPFCLFDMDRTEGHDFGPPSSDEKTLSLQQNSKIIHHAVGAAHCSNHSVY